LRVYPWLSVAIRVDQAWIEAVCARCDPVFAAADVGFIRQIQKSSEGAALLWEADPQLFAARYPDRGIIESYGRDQWATVPCIDYWSLPRRRIVTCAPERRRMAQPRTRPPDR
jgi:hypothetical protein